MRVTVALMGPFKRAAGVEGDVVVSPPEPTLGGVLRAIADRWPEAGRKLESRPGGIDAAVRVVVNDVLVASADISTPLKDGDRVVFVPVVGGG